MKHLGDITKISGYEVPIVDVVVGGSPCQDLSMAGKRAGLDGERSGLFMEQIRIIKEMRENDIRGGRTGSSVRPRYMVWENVPGAFSSNKGEDFRVVLEETAKVADKDAVIPSPPKGKWTTSGCVMGDGWSIAWRVLDAQFYGVPQRRRRIALVADFGGESASEILFIRKSVSRDTEQGKQERQTASSDAEGSTGADNRAFTLKIRSGCEGGGKGALIQTDKSATLSTLQDQTLFQPVVYENHSQDSRYKELGNVCETISAKYGTGGNNQPLVVACDRASFSQGKNARYDFDINESGVASTLVAKGPSAVCYSIDEKCANTYVWEEQANTLAARDYKQPQAVCYSIDQGGGKSSASVSEGITATLTCTHGGEPAVCYWDGGQIAGTLTANNASGSQRMPDKENFNCVIQSTIKYMVRRLTPLECERLQGYPDDWTDIGEWVDSNGKTKKTSDTARYKALGNSIAIPPWKWVMKRISACYERDATLASLFDGIGGFPYIWEQINGKGSCLWASEIEEFPIAVTKKRIGGE